MLSIEWTTRRYSLPSFSEKELRRALEAWVRSRKCSVYAMPKIDIKKLYWSTAYAIADSKLALMTKMLTSLYVSYRAPVLYVFSIEDKKLPSACSGIFDEFFAPYALSHGGKPFEETPLIFTTSYLMTSPLSHFESRQVDFTLLVHIDPSVQRVEAAREEIHLTDGANVTVKRARTISHSVEVMDTKTISSQLEAGLKFAHLDILKATVKGEIQKQTGSRLEESETVEHEITLSGRKKAKLPPIVDRFLTKRIRRD
jgi:hypothetical protein